VCGVADIASIALLVQGRCGKRTAVRRRIADMTLNMPNGGARIGSPWEVPMGCGVLASYGGRCEHGDSDQSGRHELDYGH
jgi:hypothetical protein